MKIKVGMAKINKYAMQHCGDSFDIIERPYGGLSAVIADGQGNGLAAHHTSSWVVNKAASLIADGARDGAVARAVHDYLYAMKDKKVSCTLTLLSADLESETVVISRNSNCPTIVKTDEYLTIYDDEVSPIGVNRHMKPLVYELPFAHRGQCARGLRLHRQEHLGIRALLGQGHGGRRYDGRRHGHSGSRSRCAEDRAAFRFVSVLVAAVSVE